MAGVLSSLAFIIGYIERRIGTRYPKIILAAIAVALFDAIVSALLHLAAGYSAWVGLLLLFLVVIVIEGFLGNMRDMQYIITIGSFLLMVLAILVLGGLVTIAPITASTIEYGIGNIVYLVISDIFYALFGASLSTLIQSIKE